MKRTREKAQPVESDTDRPFEESVRYFMETDPTIAKTGDLLASYTWANAFRVRWGESMTMRFFEIPRVKSVFIRKMNELRSCLRACRYAAIYYYKDHHKWLLDFEDALAYNNGVADGDVLLPFGVVRPDMGKFVVVRPRGKDSLNQIIQFQPENEELEKVYSFAVFNDGATFWPIGATNDSLTDLLRGSGIGSRTFYSGTEVLRPVSVFSSLYEMRLLIEELQEHIMNASFHNSFPITYATAAAIPKDPIDTVTDDNLATAASLNQARSKGNQEASRFSLARAGEIISSIKNAMERVSGSSRLLSVRHSADDNSVSSQLAQKYGRMNPERSIRAIPDFISISNPREAHSDVDIVFYREQFEAGVCRAMNFPLDFFKTQVKTSGNTSGASNVTFSEKILTDSIREEQQKMKQIFSWVYATVFNRIDESVQETLMHDYQQLTDEEAKSTDVVSTLKYMERMFSSDEGHATLEFELLSVTSIESLKSLLEFQQLGVVDKLLVHRNAQKLFGHTLGSDSEKYTMRINPKLSSNLNAPLMPPVDPDTSAKLDSDARTREQDFKLQKMALVKKATDVKK